MKAFVTIIARISVGLCAALLGTAMLIALAGHAHAGGSQFKGRTKLVACDPFVNADGTQVLAMFARARSLCNRPVATVLVRVTDMRHRVMCSYVGNSCKHRDSLEGAARRHYDAMQSVWQTWVKNPTSDAAERDLCPPQTDGKTFRIEIGAGT